MQALTELEERLSAPQGANLQDRLATSLEDTARRLRSRIDHGLPATEFTTAQALLDATQAAREVLDRWPTRQLTQ